MLITTREIVFSRKILHNRNESLIVVSCDIFCECAKHQKTKSESTLLYKKQGCIYMYGNIYIYHRAHKSFHYSFRVIGACCDNGIQREFVMIHRSFYRFSLSRNTLIPAVYLDPGSRSSLSLSLDNNLPRDKT